jgi:hypothetical protein
VLSGDLPRRESVGLDFHVTDRNGVWSKSFGPGRAPRPSRLPGFAQCEEPQRSVKALSGDTALVDARLNIGKALTSADSAKARRGGKVIVGVDE